MVNMRDVNTTNPQKLSFQLNIGNANLKAFSGQVENLSEYIEDLYPDVDGLRPKGIKEFLVELNRLGKSPADPKGLFSWLPRYTENLLNQSIVFSLCNATEGIGEPLSIAGQVCVPNQVL